MHLLIDLDGTLTDPFPGITRCIQHALESLGKPVPDAESLAWCIGPPLLESFVTLVGDPDEAEEALKHFRERFGRVGMFENKVYPGILPTLRTLRDAGHSLLLATSKPRVYAEKILDHFGLSPLFDGRYGSELDGTRADKAHLIRHILEEEALNPQETLMIGDREHDIRGARQNKIRSVGVLWGYGTRSELETAGADQILQQPEQLPELIASGI